MRRYFLHQRLRGLTRPRRAARRRAGRLATKAGCPARVGAPSARGWEAGGDALVAGPYVFDPSQSVARLHGDIVELTQRQFELAVVLFRNTGRLLSRQYLLEAVWGLNDAVQTRTLDIHISQLRNLLRLSDNGWRIQSVYAHGYRLETLA